eukprot:4703988-Amphidinium_carterae.1
MAIQSQLNESLGVREYYVSFECISYTLLSSPLLLVHSVFCSPDVPHRCALIVQNVEQNLRVHFFQPFCLCGPLLISLCCNQLGKQIAASHSNAVRTPAQKRQQGSLSPSHHGPAVPPTKCIPLGMSELARTTTTK